MQMFVYTKMKIYWLLISIIFTQTCFAQFKVTNLDKTTIPKSIRYDGNIVEAVRWTDKTVPGTVNGFFSNHSSCRSEAIASGPGATTTVALWIEKHQQGQKFAK